MSLSSTDHIFVAGHNGMVGSAIVRTLKGLGFRNIVTRSRDQLDLRDQAAVNAFYQKERVDVVVVAAAKVGGIHANNNYPADFIYENLCIQNNLIGLAHEAGIKRLLFLGSSCIYPKLADQPISEAELLTGPLEPTNEPYAIAKIAGIKLCESFNRQFETDYRSVMPTNLYGPGDNFHPENSHVIPALIRRFHQAKTEGREEVNVWGSGTPRREFLHVDDVAEACLHILMLERDTYWPAVGERLSHINVGAGKDCTIKELAGLIADVVGYLGEINFDTSRPDGTPQKLLDVSKMTALGWTSRIGLRDGLASTYQWMCDHTP